MQCLTPIYVSKVDMVVPCGRCSFCAATRRSDWATRLEYESKLHLDKKFITLTYANPHLHWKHGNSQLHKPDVQRWFKRVRKAGYKVRYFLVGEYGSTTFRPHYHVLLFGSVPEDFIRRSWKLGTVHIGTITQASINYCLGYIVSGKSWKMNHYREKPFSLMSKGLGKNYLSAEMIAWHKPTQNFSDYRNYVLVDGVKRHLPRYYKLKIFPNKIDQVRLAVRDQKQIFKNMVEWIRHPSRAKMRDPMAYRRQQMLIAAKRIKLKSKENLTI